MTITLSRPTFCVGLLLLVATVSGLAQAPVANFISNVNTGCAPLAVQFTDQSTNNPFSWNWDFGNGQLSTARNPSISYSLPGTYTVRLVVRNAAGIAEEIKTDYITVSPSAVVSFVANMTTACAPATIQFTDQSTTPPGAGTITDWLWDFGDGNTSNQQNPTHTYTTTGFYTVSLQITSSSGCRSFTSIGRYIRIVSGIDVNFAFTEPATCVGPFLINFQDQSSGPGTLNYLWNFGNGGPTSTLQNPSAIYATPGVYTVQLSIQSDLGCTGNITRDITISGKTTDFIVSPTICIGQTVTFQNNSSPSPISSSWDFGDGTTSSQTNPVKTFLTAGTFPIKLINNYGNCIDSITKPVTVLAQPTVDFTANDSTSCSSPFTVQFTDNSPVGANWLWDFGDGSTSTQQNPVHTYTTPGYYDVSLTISLPGGCTNTLIKQQYIQIQPVVINFTNVPAGGCIPFSFSPLFTIQTVDNIVSYSWDMGEPGATYSTQFPTHTYTTAGNFTVTLTVTTQSGCTQTLTVPNAVLTGTPPSVNFSFAPNNVCAITPVQFTDLSTTTPGADVRWLWEFGDGITSNLQNPVHTYRDTGILIVRLTVFNNGCTARVEQPIQVLPPVAIFGYTVNCNNNLQVTFADTSLVNPIYGAITYEWRMGDPANTIFFGLPPPTFTYPAFGTYTATLIVTNGPCSYTTTHDVVLVDEAADFTISKNPVCRDETFTLSAINSNASSIASYNWTVGGTVLGSTARSVDHSIGAYGSYDVTLTTTDINGCTLTKTVANYITVRGPVADFNTTTGGACVNKAVIFNDLSTPAGTITQWSWNFGDGGQQSFTGGPFTHTYNQTGSYNVKLIVRDNANCYDSITRNNYVVITSPIAAFRADTIYCPQSPLQFSDTSIGSGLSYNWDFGDGGTSTLQNPTHSYPPGDNSYTVKLRIIDLVGCEDSVTKNLYVDIRSPKPEFDMQDSTGICIPLVTTFTFRGTDYSSFYWDFGDGTTSTAMNPAHFYNAYGTYTPKLYLVGPGGCIDSSQGTVTIYNTANEQINFNPGVACNSALIDLSFTTPPGFKFKFYFGDGTIDSSLNHSLTHFYSTPGVYTPYVQVTDRFGCEGYTIGAPITIWGAIPLFSKDKKEFCDNGEVFFVNYTLSNDPVTSTVWDFGDGNTSNTFEPSHVYTGPGTYIVRLTVSTQNQCTSSFTDTIRVYSTPQLSLVARDTICVNSSERFTAQIALPDSTINWRWDLGNGNTSEVRDPVVVYTTPGDYTARLIAYNKLGCADTLTHRVHVVAIPTAVPVVTPITIISGASTQLNMTYTGAIASYNWIPVQRLDCADCPYPMANPQFTTNYVVQVQDRYGCRGLGEITVQVVCNGQNFFIPNTFSPNGDGSNDVFYPRGTGLFRIKAFRIFNRWGQVVFEKREFPVNDPGHGWDGRYRGQKPMADVYVYQVELLCANGELVKYSGNIALIQ
jgi:gliding motility-associated-like protein